MERYNSRHTKINQSIYVTTLKGDSTVQKKDLFVTETTLQILMWDCSTTMSGRISCVVKRLFHQKETLTGLVIVLVGKFGILVHLKVVALLSWVLRLVSYCNYVLDHCIIAISYDSTTVISSQTIPLAKVPIAVCVTQEINCLLL